MPSLVVNNLDAQKRALLESWGVRDYPVLRPRDPMGQRGDSDELCCLPAEKLLESFHHDSKNRLDLYRLVYNIVWQAYTLIVDKRRPPIDGDLRTFWYSDIKTPLSNLGVLEGRDLAWEKSVLSFSGVSSKLGLADADILDWHDLSLDGDANGQMNHTAGYISNVISDVFYGYISNLIFHFRDFGFTDDLGEARFPATTRPQVIFAAEKTTFRDFAKGISEEFGCSSQCLRGQPKLLTSEYFANELSEKIDLRSHEFLILGCADYDPWGEVILEQFQEQLKLFGLANSKVVHLITPDIIGPDVLKQLKYKIPIRSQTVQTEVDAWIARGGGIDGQAYGLECDMVPKPLIRERIAKALRKEGM